MWITKLVVLQYFGLPRCQFRGTCMGVQSLKGANKGLNRSCWNKCLWSMNILQCTPLNEAMFKKPSLGYTIQSGWNGFFILLCVQNIPVYKAILPVLASVCTIHLSATFTRKSCDFSWVSVTIWVIISFNELHVVLEKINPPITW